MNVPVKYSYLIKTLLMSLIFVSIFPLGFCISLLGFIFAYWLEKFNFSKMYKKPEKLDKQISEYYLMFFIIIFLAYGLGYFYFLQENDIYIIKRLKIKEKNYDDMYLEFVTDYEGTNPMTRIEGEMRYLDKLEENYKINKSEKDKRKKKIKEENQMKFYLKRQRLSKIINIKELNNILLNLEDNDDNNEQEKEKNNTDDNNINDDIVPNIEVYKNKETIFKRKKSNKKKSEKNKKSKNK